MQALVALSAFAAASATGDIAESQYLGNEYDDSPNFPGPQSLVLFAESSTGTGSFVFEAQLVSTDSLKVVARYRGTGTIGSLRSGPTGGAGGYLAPCVFDISGTKFLDLAGAGYTEGKVPGTGYRWKLGLISVTTVAATAITFRYGMLRVT